MFNCGCIIANKLIESIKETNIKEGVDSSKFNCPFCGIKNTFKNSVIPLGLDIEEIEIIKEKLINNKSNIKKEFSKIDKIKENNITDLSLKEID